MLPIIAAGFVYDSNKYAFDKCVFGTSDKPEMPTRQTNRQRERVVFIRWHGTLVAFVVASELCAACFCIYIADAYADILNIWRLDQWISRGICVRIYIRYFMPKAVHILNLNNTTDSGSNQLYEREVGIDIYVILWSEQW